ncbi:glycosyltransferase family 4 protein [Burkholderia ubonensis]|uniref:glycosyltransferase family 4 protein n=1 Tax=Burkholderia ubonensis TaxID=101571 RepID=UPI00075AFE47|nr:glycosyltransferase family 4 protein [Burkholderia ubonensis]KVS38474.1 glycosyl transferase [Burkholderia ubonensis]KVS43007.1 glycosyl transferase [Burkholderia ubonensis]KVS68047.1 glycosyl transferase [Burkholderia ubonensis]KVS81560.1 glycosyl transferase [Burkholderia ubonensis]KVS86779.1 glycosyl transferase [Burkholderia ubonensis]
MPMKIVLLNHSMRCGGAERVTANLANNWAERGCDVAVATFVSSDADFYKLDSRVARVDLALAGASSGVLGGMLANVRRLAAVRRLFKDRRPDVVIGVMTVPSVLCILGGIGLRLKVIATEHNHPPMLRMSAVWETLRRLTFRHADAVVALTAETGAWLAHHCRCRNVSVIPNPVALPLEVMEPRLAPMDSISADTRLLLAVGRLAPQKGFDLLIQAFEKIRERGPGWKLVILGEGEARGTLQSAIAERGLDDLVLMPGRAGNIGEWYGRADLYVMSSRFEGLPMTLMEAMGSGCAAVSFDCDVGPRDIIRDGIDGVLVNPAGDVGALADALLKLMVDTRERERMASMANDVAARFAPSRILSLWEQLFLSMGLSSADHARPPQRVTRETDSRAAEHSRDETQLR